jgi:IMP dehydrogenase
MLPSKPTLNRAYGFDDIIVMPVGSYVAPDAVNLQTQLYPRQNLRLPLLGVVGDSKQAIAMAQQGSVGILSAQMPFGDQIEAMRKVKRHQAYLLRQPLTVTPDTSAAEAADYQSRYGFSALPVLEAGTQRLVGIVTRADVLKAVDGDAPVSLVMSTNLITVKENTPDNEVRELMQKHIIGQVLVVDDNGHLIGLRTSSDFTKRSSHPFATLDAQGRLFAGAAVAVGGDTQDRILGLLDMGVDMIVLSQDFAYAHPVQEMITFIRRQRADQKVAIMVGGVHHGDGARALIDAGADMLYVQATATREKSWVHVPAFTALQDVLEASSLNKVPVWVQQDLSVPDSIFKALAAGAAGVMTSISDPSAITPWAQGLRAAIGQAGASTLADLPASVRLAHKV